MDYEAKLTEVKQARWVKPEVACSWIYVTTQNVSILWSAAWVDRKKIVLKYSFKKSLFIQIETEFFRRSWFHEIYDQAGK